MGVKNPNAGIFDILKILAIFRASKLKNGLFWRFLRFHQCAKFHFWVTPDFSDESGVTFKKYWDRDRESESGVAFAAYRAPDLLI